MNKRMFVAAAALAFLSSWGGAVSAAVEIRFVAPENFSDVRDNAFAREQTLAGIKSHLRSLAAAQFGSAASGRDLLIEITDIDRAGELEPWGRNMQEIRVLRAIGRPAINLRFVLSEGGHETRRGEARLSDLSYLDRRNHYPSGDPIRFEKRMLDEWFGQELAGAPLIAVHQP